MDASDTNDSASASIATATGIPWKLPPLWTSSSSTRTIGLSLTLLASIDSTSRTCGRCPAWRRAPGGAPQRIGILHQVGRRPMRLADRRPSNSARRFARSLPARGAGGGAGAARRTGVGPEDASIVIAAITSAARELLGPDQREGADRDHPLRAVHERESFLRLELERTQSRPAEPVGSRLRGAVAREQPSEPDQRQRQPGERREIARRPERALLRDGGDDVAVQHLDHQLDDLRAHARVPQREDVRAEHEHRARLLA
jgi:hypothetical protein